MAGANARLTISGTLDLRTRLSRSWKLYVALHVNFLRGCAGPGTGSTGQGRRNDPHRRRADCVVDLVRSFDPQDEVTAS